MAIAMSPSVTVSMAAEMIGMRRLIPRVSRVLVSVAEGSTWEYAGHQQHVVERVGFQDLGYERIARRRFSAGGGRLGTCREPWGGGPFRNLGGPS